MDEDREQLLRIITATQVSNAKLYTSISKESPLLAKLMMDKFNQFLSDEDITSIERQTLLMKFLEEQKNLDIVRDVLTFAKQCPLKDDYIKILMEWEFHNSENIIRHHLASVDGTLLCASKTPMVPILEEPKTQEDPVEQEILNNLLSVSFKLLEVNDDSDDTDDGDTMNG